MANDFSNTTFFRTAAGYGKSFAQGRNELELTPLTFLAGLLAASIVAEKGDDAQHIANATDTIRPALEQKGLVLPEKLGAPAEEKMPLSADLKRIIGEEGRSVDKFLDALLGSVAPISLSENAYALVVLPYLADYLPDQGGALVDGDAFAAAAFRAFEEGEFSAMPGLSSYFSANRTCFEALLEKRFSAPKVAKRKLPKSTVLAPDLEKALRNNSDGDGARFVAAVDIGLATGLNALSDRVTAYHEAGHAVVSSVLRPEIPINRVIVKRELDYDGVTIPDAASPHFRLGRRDGLLAELCVLLAGQAAQSLKFGRGFMDRGASSDIEKATAEAWSGIAYYGLDPEFGPVDLSIFKERNGWLFDEAQRRLQAVMKEAAARTEAILRENWIKVETVATALIATGEVDFEQFVERLTSKGLQEVPGALRAESVAVIRTAVFPRQAGSHQTPEGAIRFDAGDALMTDDSSDSWPVSRSVIDAFYVPLDGQAMGEEGRYEKAVRAVLALPLGEASRLDMSNGRGLLLGNAGDWIVDYGDGDLAIIAGSAFNRLYRLVENSG